MSQQADGYVRIDTKLDQSDLNKGLASMQKAMVAAATAMTASITAVSIAVVKVGSDYEDAAAKVSTLVDENVQSMDKISDNLLKISNNTGIAATEMAEATYQALSAGVKGTEDEITDFVEKSAKLAKAGFTTTASAVDIVTTAINGYGMRVQDADDITNQLIVTQNLGKTTVDELSKTLGRVIPTASAFGVSLGNVNTAMALMTASGINTAESSTYLKSMLNELGDTGSDVASILQDKTGKSFTELMNSGMSLGDIMTILGESVNGDATAFANLWSSAEAGTGALSIMNQGASKFNQTLNQVENSTTAVDDAYEKVTDTFSQKSKKVQESLKNVGITAYKKFEEPLKDAMDSAQNAINSLSKEMDRGKLGKSVDKIADSFSKLISHAIKLGAKTIPILVNSFSFLIDNADKLAVAITAAGATMIAYKTYKNVITPVTKAWEAATLALQAHEAAQRLTLVAASGTAGGMTVLQTVVGVLTGKISLATAAQGALNSVMSLSPASTFALGIGACAAAFVAFTVAIGDSDSALSKNQERIEEATESYEELKNTKQKALNESLSEAEHYARLAQELDVLVDANGKVKDGYEARADYIVGELNQALGMEMQMVDGVIQKYDEASSHMDIYVEKMKANAILEAQAEALKQAEELYQENLSTLSDIDSQLLSAKEEYNARMRELQEKGLEDEEIARDTRLMGLNSEITILEHQRTKTENLQQGILDDKATYYNNLTLMQEGSLESLKLINTSEIAEYDEQGNRIQASLQESAAKQLANIQSLNAAILKEKDEGKKAQLEATKNQAIENLNQLQKDLDSQVSAVVGATPEQKEAYQTLAIARIEAIKSQSNKYFGVAEKEMEDLIKGLNSKDVEVRKKALAKAKLIYDGIKDKNDEYSQVGTDIMNGVMNGLDNNSGYVFQKMFNIGATMISNFKKSLDSHSPSKKFISAAETVDQGIVVGLENEEDSIMNTMEGIGIGMIKSFGNPIDEIINNMDASMLQNIMSDIDAAVSSNQFKLNTAANATVEHEVRSIASENAVADKVLKAAIDGKLEIHVNIDGREAAIALAPLIAEELAFQ